MAIDRVRGPRPEEDVKKVCDVLRKGGIAIIPTDLGYLICTTSPEKIRLINQTKGRGAHKRNGWPVRFLAHFTLLTAAQTSWHI